MASYAEPVDVPRPRKRVTFGLIVLAVFMPWLALYLDGASWTTIGINLAIWFFLAPAGSLASVIHAIVCLCRTDKHRQYSKPARRRLRYDNHYSANTQIRTEQKTIESEPSPAPIGRSATEPPPAPVEKAPTEPPAPIQRAATEPPPMKSSATSSSTSVSSSDVEKQNPPAAAPPSRTTTAPPPRTATAPHNRIATAKKGDDPFKDPDA